MHKITDEQIDFILDDIVSNGVIIEDLQNNLLDHICCIIENEKPITTDFYEFYESILPRFFKRELKEIQEETEKLLTFRNYYAMIKTLKLVGIATIIFTFLGSVFKTFHWPGAGLLIVLGAALLCLVFLPLMIVLKFRDEEKMIDKIILSFGFLIGMGAAAGILFKIMHWPMAGVLMQGSITIFVFAYIPLYYFTRIRRTEDKLNTTVNTVLMVACGGLLYAMFNLNHNDPNQVAFQNYVEEIKQETTLLMNKNNSLINSLELNAEVNSFHQNSSELHLKLEALKNHLLGEQKSTGLVTIEQELNNYNHELMNLNVEGKLNKSTLDQLYLDHVAIPHLIQQITVAQKQIAANENKYLNTMLANN